MNNPPGTGGDRTPRSDGTDCPTLSVLLVADRAQVDRLASGLGGESVAVATETSPADALNRLESGGIDCVVSERRFPDADVVGFLRAVRDRFEAVPFVVWTDSGDEALASQAIAAGATDYLPRSADAPDYDRAVDRIRRAVSSPSHSVSDRGTAFDRISDAVHALDSSWRFTYLNDRAEELLGRTEAQLRGRYVWEAFPDAAVRSFKPEYERAMDTQEPVTFEEYSHAAESWLRVRAYPSDTGLTVYFRAVSDGRSSRLELFRTLVDHASDGFYVIDPHTSDILDVNETACRQLGYDRSELRSMSVPDINPAFSLDTWDDFVSEVRARGEKTVTGVHEAADGSTFPVEVEVSYVSLDRDYHVATVRDVTDRKRRARKLEAARKRYRTLIEAAPDPIFVADVDTGRIVEANSAAAAIRNQPREEIVGLHQSALHPEAEGDRYRELFERHVERGGTISRLEDGSPAYLVTADGDRVPVSISVETVSIDDRTLIHGIFRDVSEQKRYQRSLEAINDAGKDLLQAESDVEIATAVVDVAADVLDADAVSIYQYDECSGVLAPVAHADRLDTGVDARPHVDPGDSIVWRAFTDSERVSVDDVRTVEDGSYADTSIRSVLALPLGEHGVVVLGDTAVGAFDDLTFELTDILAANAEAALDRAERTQALQKRERESTAQTRRLEHVRQINAKIRAINQALVSAETGAETERAVCAALVDLDRYQFAWIGHPDLAANELVPTATAGVEEGYLEAVPLDLDAAAPPPAVRSTNERETIVESNIADDVQRGQWRNAALLRDFRSAIGVPLLNGDVLYGVLTIYSDRPEGFDDLSVSVLSELGSLIGYGLNAIEQRNALFGDGAVDLTVEVAERSDVFVSLSSTLSATIEIEGITPRSERTYLVYFAADGVDPAAVRSALEDVPEVTQFRAISQADRTRYEVVTVGECIATNVTELGAKPHSIVVSEHTCNLRLSIPRDRDVRSFIERVRKQYPNVELVAQQETDSVPSTFRRRSLDDRLTERQRDVLRSAYYSGFFDQPRSRTGAEVAESLGISQPAFSKQLRIAERKLLAAYYDPEL